MKAIKVLQMSVVAVFVLTAVSGVAVFLFAPQKLDDFGKLIGIIWPFFVAQVIPALIGTPLTEAVRNLTTKATPSTMMPPDDGK